MDRDEMRAAVCGLLADVPVLFSVQPAEVDALRALLAREQALTEAAAEAVEWHDQRYVSNLGESFAAVIAKLRALLPGGPR